jgi:hypothetical protein
MRLLPPPGFDSAYGGIMSVGNVGKTAYCQTARESSQTARKTVAVTDQCYCYVVTKELFDKAVNGNPDING